MGFTNTMGGRTGGAIPFKLGTSAIPFTNTIHGLIIDAAGNLYAEEEGVIDHYHNALPFTAESRVCVTFDPPVRWTQSIPFSTSNRVCLGDFGVPTVFAITRTSGGTCSYPAAGTCVAQSTYRASISSGEFPTGVWSVDNGATIVSGQGTIDVVVNGPDGDQDVTYNVTFQVTNSKGSSDLTVPFTDTKTQV